MPRADATAGTDLFDGVQCGGAVGRLPDVAQAMGASRTAFTSSWRTGIFCVADVAQIFHVPLQRAFAQSVVSVQYRLVIDLGDFLRDDREALWAARASGRSVAQLKRHAD